MSNKEKPLYTKAQIAQRIATLADEIAKHYKSSDDLVLLCVLNGAAFFFADLARGLYERGLTQAMIAFIKAETYDGTKANKPSVIMNNTIPLQNKHVLLVEDIADTRHTLALLQKTILEQHPTTLKTAVLLDKPEAKETEAVVDFVGFTLVGKPWVEGYGLDTDHKGRHRPYIIDRNDL